MTCSWAKEDYFSLLMNTDKRAHTALEMLVDDLHCDKEKTISTFLCHSGSEDFLWGLVRLLGNENARVAGNSAYIIGTLAESDLGCVRVLSLANASSAEAKKILPDLTRMLTFDDSESVMNAAGTMGTLAESHQGREWILSEKCLPQTLEHITALLHSENLWTASNAALVLARLSISELGCSSILKHAHSQHILSKLVLSLGVDEAGRGMNAAFAIGRLCDMDNGRRRLLQLSDSERMISSLAKMLSCDDTGASKNACFALSCLATNLEGHTRLLSNVHSEDILRTLSVLLNAEDSETGWFAAMTLRTLASQPKGCLRLRDHPQVIPSLKNVESQDEINADLKEEAIITLEILKRLEKPKTPTLEVIGSGAVRACWESVTTKSGFQVRYQLFDGMKCVYTGKELNCEVSGLQPNTHYSFKVRAYTEGDESPFSEPVSITTEESVPSPPQNVRVLGSTITQLKIGWEPPEELNGVLKGYYIYCGDKQEHTLETNVILTGLTASTTYDIQVCAATAKGRGERACISGTTAEIGAHAPSKPVVTVIGRNELHLAWNAPEVPLGRFNRYDITMNDKIIYSGTELNFTVRRLTPDTEYSFVVIALTSDGKFESKVARKKTAKDEYDTTRPPLYQNPRKTSMDENSLKTPAQAGNQKKRKTDGTKRISSAKRAGTAKDRSKSSSMQRDTGTPESRPLSAASSVTSTAPAGQPDIAEKPPTPGSEKHGFGPTSSGPSSSVNSGKPGTQEVKRDPPRPISKTKTFHSTREPVTRSYQKPEKHTISGSSKPQAVSVSYVSIQGSNSGEQENLEDSSGKPVETESIGNGRKVLSKPNTPSDPHGLKMERAKTVVVGGRDSRRPRVSSHKGEKCEPVSSDRSGKGDDKGRAYLHDKTNRMSGKQTAESGDILFGSVESSRFLQANTMPQEKYKTSSTHERSRGHGRNGMKPSTKDAVLPKPSLPSQQYLEGFTASTTVHSSLEADPTYRLVPSPRSLRDIGHQPESHDVDWLSQVKRVSEIYTKSVHPANMFSLTQPSDSTYFIDTPQFIQRTNTYINSHRQKLPAIKGHKPNKRPTGRKSLEKLSRMPQGNKIGSSLTFDPDIPESKTSKLGNKFIPMQLRTQPSNLGINQLQRVNTTLLGDLTGDSVQFRRLEALTRSHTQIDMRQAQQPFPVATGSHGDESTGRRDLGLLMSSSKQKDKGMPLRKSFSGSSGKVNRATLGSHDHLNKEPDSMLLQQSWGIEGAVQNVR